MTDLAARAEELVDLLVSPRVGVIRSILPQARPPDEPVPPYLQVATLSHFDFQPADGNERIGAGKGLTEAEATVSCIGEAVERYCALQWDERRTWSAGWPAVSQPAFSPADLVLYSAEQYERPGWPFPSWDRSAEISWIDGELLPSGETVAVPASFAYLVQPPPHPEDILTSSTSNGLAAGSSAAGARLGAMCEVMERDTLLVAWMNRLPATELDLDAVDEPAANIIRRYRRSGVVVRAFVLPTDLPATTVMAVAFDDDPTHPAQVVGLGCHPRPAVALRKALFELCQARPSETQRFRNRSPYGRLERYEDVLVLDDHSAFISRADRRAELDFLMAGASGVAVLDLPDPSSGDVDEDVVHCAAALTDLGHRVAAVDLTTSDVACCGLHVVRVLVTGLQPIHFGHGNERLGGDRVLEGARRLGFATATRGPADLNPCPHPLA